ncbi:MAG: hypothetical protein RLZZ38_322, partial [Bacteroidota bacterium]
SFDVFAFFNWNDQHMLSSLFKSLGRKDTTENQFYKVYFKISLAITNF